MFVVKHIEFSAAYHVAINGTPSVFDSDNKREIDRRLIPAVSGSSKYGIPNGLEIGFNVRSEGFIKNLRNDFIRLFAFRKHNA